MIWPHVWATAVEIQTMERQTAGIDFKLGRALISQLCRLHLGNKYLAMTEVPPPWVTLHHLTVGFRQKCHIYKSQLSERKVSQQIFCTVIYPKITL